MALAAGVLGLAVLGTLLTDSPGAPGVLALPVPDHVHVVHRGLPPAALPPPLASLIVPRRRVHALDPRTAINLVNAHESRRRRGSKRPPPYHRRGPPRPGPPRAAPSHWKGGAPKRKAGPREKPWNQVTRGSSPAATRVRYQSSKAKTKKKSKTKKSRPLVPTYADGYAEDDDIRDQRRDPDEDADEDRPRKRPSKSSSSSSSSKQHGWGSDGGYRVPAPQYPPYGTDEEEPGTGHLDLEERFINQHNQFYQHGYPADSSEGTPSVPASTQSKRKPANLAAYEDEEIEVAEAPDDFADSGTTSHTVRHTSYRRPSKTTRYSLQDGALHEASESDEDYRRPSKSRSKKKPVDNKRHQSMYHAKFRGEHDERTLSAANFNYELSGAASETQTSVNKNVASKTNKSTGNNHRPVFEEAGVTDVRTADTNFFRTRKPQYWG